MLVRQAVCLILIALGLLTWCSNDAHVGACLCGYFREDQPRREPILECGYCRYWSSGLDKKVERREQVNTHTPVVCFLVPTGEQAPFHHIGTSWPCRQTPPAVMECVSSAMILNNPFFLRSERPDPGFRLHLTKPDLRLNSS